MRIKHMVMIVFTCFLVLTLGACTSHRKPSNVGVVDANSMHGPGDGAETYTQGIGGDNDNANGSSANGSCDSIKCRAGRPVGGAEQHYFFDFDSNELRPEAMASVQLQANYLMKHPNAKIRLEGNTDDRGSREYNVALGERRARCVLDALKQYGVSSSQVTIVSFGAEKPAAGGEDEQSYQCNRRVDLIYCGN